MGTYAGCLFLALSPVDGHVLAKDRTVSDGAVALFALEGNVLGLVPNDGASMYFYVSADSCPPGHVNVWADARTVADNHLSVNDCVGADADVGSDFHVGSEDSCFVNH